LERLQQPNDEMDSLCFCSFERRWPKAAFFSFPLHRPAALTSNRCSAANTLARSNRTQRGLILINGIFFARCQLSIDLADTESALASSLRLSSAGSFAADPVADTELRCVIDFCFVSTHHAHARQARIRYFLTFFLRNERSRKSG
jgi:hypothetical protein